MPRRTPPKSKSAALERDGVTWTSRLRERVFGSPRPMPGDPEPPGRDEAWKRACALYGKRKLYSLPDEVDPKLQAPVDEVREELLGRAVPATTTLEREEIRIALLMSEGALADENWFKAHQLVVAALVPFWAGLQGAGFAAERVWSPLTLQLSSVSCGDARRLSFVKRSAEPSRAPGFAHEHWWLQLRRSVLAAPAAEYDAAARSCRAAKASPSAMAATFCRDPAEANRLAARQKEEEVNYGSIALFSGITDAAVALQFARAQPLNYAHGATFHAFNLVDNLGAAAAPSLVALLERVSSGGDARKALASAAVLADAKFCRAALPKLEGPAATTLAAALK